MEPLGRRTTPIFLVELGIACVATLCIIISFTGNGLTIRDKGTETESTGLWYVSRCSKSDGCESFSLKKLFDDSPKNKFDKFLYLNAVVKQVAVTMSLFFIFCIDILYMLVLAGAISHERIRHVNVAFCIMIGGMLLIIFGYEGRQEMINSKHHGSDYMLFPWTLVTLGLGGFVAVVLGGFNLVMKCLQSRNVDRPHKVVSWKPRLVYLEFVLSILDLICQLAGHGSDSISKRVLNENAGTGINNSTIDGSVSSNISNDAIHRTVRSEIDKSVVKENLGVWYAVFCNMSKCFTSPRLEYNMIDSSNSAYSIDSRNSTIIGTQVVTTIATLCIFIAVILYGISICRRIIRTSRIHLLAFCTISGVLQLYLWAAEVAFYQIRKEDNTYVTYGFPWAIVVFIISSVLSLIIGGLNVINISLNDMKLVKHAQHVQIIDLETI